MSKFFTTSLGLFRVLCFLEGLSLLLLIFVGMPFKYYLEDASLVKSIGPIHGVLFLLFIVAAIYVSIQEEWKFKELTWKVLLACIVPFGTFYVDHKYLKDISKEKG